MINGLPLEGWPIDEDPHSGPWDGPPGLYPYPNPEADTYQASLKSDYSIYGGEGGSVNLLGYADGTPLNIPLVNVLPQSSGTVDTAFYYSGYWANVQAQMYGRTSQTPGMMFDTGSPQSTWLPQAYPKTPQGYPR